MTTEALKLLIEECENANATGVAVIDLNAIAKAKEALAAPVAADIEMPPLPAIQVTNSIEQAQIHDLREQNEKRACLYRESDWQAICAGISAHTLAVGARVALAA